MLDENTIVSMTDLQNLNEVEDIQEETFVNTELLEKSNVMTNLMIALLIFVIGGIFGFVYEELFYRVDLGYFVKRGTTFGPWIPIYGFGALLITLSTYKVKNKPWAVFLVGGGVCGIIEFVTGYLLYHNGEIRLWNYNTEILNWGNINGYICFRSVAFFAISSLFLMYAVIPFIKLLQRKIPAPVFRSLSIVLSFLFFFDFFAANIINLY